MSPEKPVYAVAEKALLRWAKERLRRNPRPNGGMAYSFAMSGSTCTNMGRPIEVVMNIEVGADGRIEGAFIRPAEGDIGWNSMCATSKNADRFLAEAGDCADVIGLTLREAAFREWNVEESGCFCVEGNRRHKWRNTFQAIYFAETNQIP
jgi:hypothetical protein